jgi:sugar diacid utilization regulator
MNLFTPPKLVKGIHIRFGENPIELLSLFSLHASKQNWDQQEILNVMNQAKTGDYMNLIKTLRAHIKC